MTAKPGPSRGTETVSEDASAKGANGAGREGPVDNGDGSAERETMTDSRSGSDAVADEVEQDQDAAEDQHDDQAEPTVPERSPAADAPEDQTAQVMVAPPPAVDKPGQGAAEAIGMWSASAAATAPPSGPPAPFGPPPTRPARPPQPPMQSPVPPAARPDVQPPGLSPDAVQAPAPSAVPDRADAPSPGLAGAVQTIKAKTKSAAEAAKPGGGSRGAPRKAHLVLRRVEPWSMMKFSFVMSLVCFVVLFVAVAVLYFVLYVLGVFDAVAQTLANLTSADGGEGGINARDWFSASRILGITALVGALNVILITALSTLGAVIYNIVADLVGGVEVTLSEAE